MAEYHFREIEKKWQKSWAEKSIYKPELNSTKPKYYVLDMFPYPSGAGLHVGHPLGYIASDIVARYKRLKGFNVLHPMGYDAFGLPAEQYAIQTGQHPAITTEKNISKYREQLDNIGFSFDWSREVRTCEPEYYKWTQWIFLKLFGSWYNKVSDKAEPIEKLIATFEKEGNKTVNAASDEGIATFTGEQWKAFSEKEQQETLLKYRLAFLADTTVNWCPALGTVLANEEVKDGVSERGGYPVVRKEMKQWSLRITAYADRLLNDLETLDWPEPVKDMQRNWINKSFGAEMSFKVIGQDAELVVFTTRPDTTFGVTFVSICPEHELLDLLVTPEQKTAVGDYVEMAKNRSERDRMSDVKTISGVFTGSYVMNPFTNEEIPVWIADYVLAGYGTGAVMAVPSSDPRDYNFAKHFSLPITAVQEGEGSDITKENFDPKAGTMINSSFLNGLTVKEAIPTSIKKIEELGIGKGKVNFRMRDAIFSRQRYWGEPIPVYFNDGLPYPLKEKELPLLLPEIDEYKPTESGEPPLGRAKDWKYTAADGKHYQYELSTMPGWAGSSWYFLRYMDPKNANSFADADIEKYWNTVDLYIGGSEHATGHLLYSRFWNKFLFDYGLITSKEPFQKMINQGMIQGRSNLVCKEKNANVVICKNQLVEYAKENTLDLEKDFIWLHVDVNLVDSRDNIKVEDIKRTRLDLHDAKFEFSLDETGYEIIHCDHLVEKMSKSKFNVVNPDDVVEKYGADTLRLYEMFLGPLEQFKPWNTNSIDGVARFLRKLWRLFYDDKGTWVVTDTDPTKDELRILHKTIKKVEEDIERFSFNTSVSNFMICVNELATLKSSNKTILQDLLLVVAPYAPHIAEELWSKLGNKESIVYAKFPVFKEEFITESNHVYPISINGKVRAQITFPLGKPVAEIEAEALANEQVAKWLEGQKPKKVIVVPGKIVNVVL